MTRRGLRYARQGSLAAAVAVSLLTAPSAGAETFKPTRFNDPAPGPCKPKDCSLREAITAANQADGPDRVVLRSGEYEITRPDDGTDDNDDGDFDITSEMTIKGAGAKKTTVNGNFVHGVFQFLGFSPRKINGLTVSRGNATNSAGGIFIGPSAATVRDVVVKSSVAPGNGGGIVSFSPELTLDRVTLRGNAAGQQGGGIFLGVSVADSDVLIRSSAIYANEATDGAGLTADETDTTSPQNQLSARVSNSTIDGNKAENDGGGALAIAGATLKLDHVTVAHNTAEVDGSGGGAGGGVAQPAGATFVVVDSIVAANTVGATGSSLQCFGSLSGAGNMVSSPAGCSSFPAGPNVVPSDPRIRPLAANGGPTRTVALRAGSPAIGFANGCPARDQRGVKRPANCDSGAFERKGP